MDKKERDELIMKYAPLVKNIAGRFAIKVPQHIADRDDLINVGIIGLISAIEKFDKGIQSIIIGDKTPQQVVQEVQAVKVKVMEKEKRRKKRLRKD